MKVAVKCESPLLQKSLELFLGKYLSPLKSCDVVISDQKLDIDKKSIYISDDENADLVKPFSRSQLILALEKLIKSDKEAKNILSLVEDIDQKEEAGYKHGELDFRFLQERIEKLTKEYQENLIKTIRAFYEK
ncbi:hypothetical protein [Sulfurimonas sp. HSL-1716]|uniref:hypothetical protein n=1 Tax=Hydrocurvibacter sulfurireducens TaxID=3131937 RepID=UPI0031F92468